MPTFSCSFCLSQFGAHPWRRIDGLTVASQLQIEPGTLSRESSHRFASKHEIADLHIDATEASQESDGSRRRFPISRLARIFGKDRQTRLRYPPARRLRSRRRPEPQAPGAWRFGRGQPDRRGPFAPIPGGGAALWTVGDFRCRRNHPHAVDLGLRAESAIRSIRDFRSPAWRAISAMISWSSGACCGRGGLVVALIEHKSIRASVKGFGLGPYAWLQGGLTRAHSAARKGRRRRRGAAWRPAAWRCGRRRANRRAGWPVPAACRHRGAAARRADAPPCRDLEQSRFQVRRDLRVSISARSRQGGFELCTFAALSIRRCANPRLLAKRSRLAGFRPRRCCFKLFGERS